LKEEETAVEVGAQFSFLSRASLSPWKKEPRTNISRYDFARWPLSISWP